MTGMNKLLAQKNVIGGQVRKFRRRLGWSQEQLAQALELEGIKSDQESIDRLENQARKVYDKEVQNLAMVLGVKMYNLFPTKFWKERAKIAAAARKRPEFPRSSGAFTKAGKKVPIGHAKENVRERFGPV